MIRTLVITAIATIGIVLSAPAGAKTFDTGPAFRGLPPGYDAPERPDLHVTQGGCKSLDEAIESVRRRGNVDRIISAETRGSTHYIRYVTKDGTVRTDKFRACR